MVLHPPCSLIWLGRELLAAGELRAAPPRSGRAPKGGRTLSSGGQAMSVSAFAGRVLSCWGLGELAILWRAPQQEPVVRAPGWGWDGGLPPSQVGLSGAGESWWDTAAPASPEWALRHQNEAVGFQVKNFSSVTQSCPTLCDPMDCSRPGLPVHHRLWSLLKLMSIQSVSDIKPSHPLSSPFPLALSLSQH